MEEDAEGTPNRRQFSILFSILFSIFWYRLSIDKYKYLNDDITFLRMEEGAEGTPNRRQLALPWIWWWGSSFQPTHPPRLKRSAPPSFYKSCVDFLQFNLIHYILCNIYIMYILYLIYIESGGGAVRSNQPTLLTSNAPLLPLLKKSYYFFIFWVKIIKSLISKEGPPCLKRSAPSSFVKVLVNHLL